MTRRNLSALTRTAGCAVLYGAGTVIAWTAHMIRKVKA